MSLRPRQSLPAHQPELAKFGVRAITCKRIECLHCHRRWSVKPGRAGELPLDFWKCSDGCNASLVRPGVRQQDKLEIEVHLADARYTPSQSLKKTLGKLKRQIRMCDTLRALYARMRSNNPPSRAAVQRICGFRKLSTARRGRVPQPKTSTIKSHD